MEHFVDNMGPYGSPQVIPDSTNITSKNTDLEDIENLKANQNTGVCRLCLTEIKDNNFTLLEGIIKDMLEILLPELKLSICDTPAMCKTCLETLKQSYNFKSTCLEVEDNVQDYVVPEVSCLVDLKQVIRKPNQILVINNNQVICRTCLNIVARSACTQLCSFEGDHLKNMVEKCLPEMGLDLTLNPVLCPTCLELLEEQFHFIMQCLDTEEKINFYCETKNVHEKIDLISVYQFSVCMEDNEDNFSTQYSHIENEYEDEDTHPTSENVLENATEQPVKNELDNNPVQEACIPKLESNNSKDKVPFKLFPPEENNEITKQYVTVNLDDIDDGPDDNSDIVSVTSVDELLVPRVIVSENESENVVIDDEKNVKVDNEKDEVESVEDPEDFAYYPNGPRRLLIRKCKQCDFKTKFKSRMKAHITLYHTQRRSENQKSNKSVSENEDKSEREYHCRRCSFKTKEEVEYKTHKDYHKRSNEKKCPNCDLVFHRKDFYEKHIASHKQPSKANNTNLPTKLFTKKNMKKNPVATLGSNYGQKQTYRFDRKILTMYRCNLCPYQSRLKANFARHSLIHKKTSYIKTHKCKFCIFETIYKENFLVHMQSHNSDNKEKIRKCFLCSFETKKIDALKNHVELVHKSGSVQ